MRHPLAVAYALSVALLVTVPVSAHHTGSTLLSEKTVTLKGTVQSWLWSNPHCLLKIAVTGADGQVAEWTVEAQAPNSIYPDGYRKNSFKPGDNITVTLNPAVNGGPYGRIAHVILADGTALGNLPGEGGRRRGGAAQ